MTYPIPRSTSEPNQLLVKLSKTGIVPEDTYVYYEIEHFKKNFPSNFVNKGKSAEAEQKLNRWGNLESCCWRLKTFQSWDILPLGTKVKLPRPRTIALSNIRGNLLNFGTNISLKPRHVSWHEIFGKNQRKRNQNFDGGSGASPIFVVHKTCWWRRRLFLNIVLRSQVHLREALKWQILIDLFCPKPILSKNFQRKGTTFNLGRRFHFGEECQKRRHLCSFRN